MWVTVLNSYTLKRTLPSWIMQQEKTGSVTREVRVDEVLTTTWECSTSTEYEKLWGWQRLFSCVLFVIPKPVWRRFSPGLLPCGAGVIWMKWLSVSVSVSVCARLSTWCLCVFVCRGWNVMTWLKLQTIVCVCVCVGCTHRVRVQVYPYTVESIEEWCWTERAPPPPPPSLHEHRKLLKHRSLYTWVTSDITALWHRITRLLRAPWCRSRVHSF